MLRGRFDFILGNPPWLSYRYIADPDYQAQVKALAVRKYAVAPRSQHLLTQMELAAVFLVHALTVFGTPEARLAFVMPRSVLSADQHTNLRTRRYRNAPLRVDGYWDLAEVRPVFQVPSCVVFAIRHPNILPVETYELDAVEWSGRIPNRNLSWAEAEPLLKQDAVKGRLIWLGQRNALSSKRGSLKPTKTGAYAGLFKNGATIFPRCFYFVAPIDERPPDPSKQYWAETDPVQAASAKEPWDTVRLGGNVDGKFLFSSVISKHVLPFVVLEPADVVLPVETGKSGTSLLDPEALRKQGHREAADWFDEVERVWRGKRGAKAGMTALEYLNYQGKLTAQSPRAPHRVIYNATGTDLSAASVPKGGRFERLFIDHKLYYMQYSSKGEAAYLAAVLNSRAVNEVIKPFQSRGLMGERDIHKKVLELPIPLFDDNKTLHADIAELGLAAAERAAEVAGNGLPPSLARRRSALRTALRKELTRIDALIRQLLKQGQ